MSYKTTTQARSLPMGYGAQVIDGIERDIKGKSPVMKKAILSRERKRNDVRRRMMTNSKDKETVRLIDRYIELLEEDLEPKKKRSVNPGKKSTVKRENSFDKIEYSTPITMNLKCH